MNAIHCARWRRWWTFVWWTSQCLSTAVLPVFGQGVCPKGFIHYQTMCEDIDECGSNSDDCHRLAECRNTPGTFECVCRHGYTGDGQNSCSDVNECVHRKTCSRHATCLNTDGSYECTCVEGYQGNGLQCADVNECTENVHDCHPRARCVNNNGSYWCLCSRGYRGDGIQDCDDVDECRRPTACPTHAACQNTMGAFKCHCKDGFRKLLTLHRIEICTDVNECDEELHSCSLLATCMNLHGDYKCMCQIGYHGDGFNCDDINECTALDSPCHSNATCTNTLGSYQCLCLPGFEGNGTTCSDEDECNTGHHDCHSNGECFNSFGYYDCQCQNGYDGNGTSCIDNDECLLGMHNCHTAAQCANTEGSFKCSCVNGYEGTGVECWDKDECDRRSHSCHQKASCSNTPGSYTCSCVHGFSGNGWKCHDINECILADRCKHPDAYCSNVAGSFECRCVDGYSGNGTICEPIGEAVKKELQSLVKYTATATLQAVDRLQQLSATTATDSQADIKETMVNYVEVMENLAKDPFAQVDGDQNRKVSDKVLQSILQVASNIQSSSATALSDSQSSHNTSSRLVTVLEKISEHFPPLTTNDSVKTQDFESPGIQMTIQDNTRDFDLATHFHATYYPSIGSAWVRRLYHTQLDDGGGSAHPQMQSVSIHVSPRALSRGRCLSSPSSCVQRLVFTTYASSNFFQQKNSETNQTVAPQSLIASARIYNWSFIHLEEDVNITFSRPLNLDEKPSQRPVCVYWNFAAHAGRGGWQDDGCRLVKVTRNNIYCSCSHLTNFALLLADSADTSKELAIFTYIGCLLSIGSLTLTLLIHFIVRSFRRLLPAKIIAGLSASLLAVLLAFLAGIEATEDKKQCQVVAILLHYFLLSSFCWMAVGAYNIYFQLVRVFGQHSRNFVLRAAIFSHGLPGMIVLSTALLSWNDYGSSRVCRVQGWPFYISLVVPLAALFVFNMAVFSIVAYKMSTRTIATASSQRKRFRLRTFLGLTMLLGLTWGFGLLLITEDHVFLQWTFTLLVSTQGFFVFLLQVATHQLVLQRFSTLRYGSRRFARGKTHLSLFNKEELLKVEGTSIISTKITQTSSIADLSMSASQGITPTTSMKKETSDTAKQLEKTWAAPKRPTTLYIPPLVEPSEVTTGQSVNSSTNHHENGTVPTGIQLESAC